MDMLNYSTQAIEYFRTAIVGFKNHGLRNDAKVLEWFCGVVRNAQKFRLPDGGRLLDSQVPNTVESLQKTADLFRLPFPETIIEYSVPESFSTVAHDAFHQVGTSDKRIAIGIDINSPVWKTFPFQGLNGALAILKNDYQSDGALVASIFSHEKTDGWNPPVVFAFIPYAQTITRLMEHKSLSDTILKSEEFQSRVEERRINPNSPIASACPVILMQELAGKSEEAYGGREAFLANSMFNLADEANALLEFCSIVNCSNVSTSVVPASQKLNKKRAITRKTPYFDYRILEINAAPVAAVLDAPELSEAERQSPRAHLRRGHIRRIGTEENKRMVWINAVLIGAADVVAKHD